MTVAGSQGSHGAERPAMTHPLTEEEERLLIQRYQRERDLRARDALCRGHLPFVISRANRWAGSATPKEDLTQQGVVGLLQALERFDLRARVRFLSYAVHWIDAAVREAALRQSRLVQPGRGEAWRRLLYGYRKLAAQLHPQRLELSEDDADAISAYLHASPEHVRRMLRYLQSREVSLEQGREHGDRDGIESIPSPNDDPETVVAERERRQHLRRTLSHAMRQKLTEREREVMHMEFNRERAHTPAETAKELGVSVDRVRRVRANALSKLRTFLAANAGELQ